MLCVDVWHVECHADDMEDGRNMYADMYAYLLQTFPLHLLQISHNTGAIYCVHNIGKYDIFHRPDKTIVKTW